jgi:hypothetical protein
MFLGGPSGTYEGRHFWQRELHGARIKPMLEVMRPQNPTGYATACAERNEQDHAALVAATRAGRLEARLE